MNDMDRRSTMGTNTDNAIINMQHALTTQTQYLLFNKQEDIRETKEHLQMAQQYISAAAQEAGTPRTMEEYKNFQNKIMEFSAGFGKLVQFVNDGNDLRRNAETAARQGIESLQKIAARAGEEFADDPEKMFHLATAALACGQEVNLSLLAIREYIITPTTTNRKAIENSLQDLTAQLDTLSSSLTDADRRLLGVAQKHLANYGVQTNALLTIVPAQLKEQSLLEQIAIDAEKLGVSLATSMQTRIDAAATTAYLLTGIAGALALLISMFTAFFLSKNVTRQLGADPAVLAATAQRVASGDYAIDDGKPHWGVYLDLLHMVAALKENIGQAREQAELARQRSEQAAAATEQARLAQLAAESAKREGMLAAAHQLEEVTAIVSAASEELSAQVEQSERGAAEQAARVSETATAVEEMNSTVLEVAKNAGTAAEVSASTKARAQEGAKVVDGVVSAIGYVQRDATALKEDMKMLTEHAQNISQIMGVISDIADQTNLLALNAAIEAARAGDAGRGFAVVADEVRKLAEKTMASTTDVGNAIKAIQQSVDASTRQVDATVKNVENATAMATQSGTALEEIVSMADATADQVRAIATASEEQSSTSEEITKSITQVSNIATETARAMQEAAHAVSDMAQQSQVLSRLIADMKRG